MSRLFFPMKLLLDENTSALEQAIVLLPRLTEAQYRHRHAACFNASIGGHIRHNIDHYLSFLDGFASGKIDYEARQRDVRIETERDYALAMLKEAAARLGSLAVDATDKTLCVRMESVGENHPSAWGASTGRRELLFLLSHTIHHYALVAVCCRLLGMDPGEEFGLAPSTLRHRQSLATKVA